ncbi:MAG TPA: DUF4256 domain-containing protein, partial [Porphyromonadaceae bacterium]|nr:DUF4256 domain-containing protein [Porphyromonadaceae bacterium]
MEKNKITQEQKEKLFNILKKRFEKNMGRHPELSWKEIQEKLEGYPEKL